VHPPHQAQQKFTQYHILTSMLQSLTSAYYNLRCSMYE